MRLAELLAHVPDGTMFIDPDTREAWTLAQLRDAAARFDDQGDDWVGGRAPNGKRRIGAKHGEQTTWVLIEVAVSDE